MRNHDVRSVGGILSSFQDFRGGWLGPTAKAVGYGLSSLPGLIGAWWLDLRPLGAWRCFAAIWGFLFRSLAGDVPAALKAVGQQSV